LTKLEELSTAWKSAYDAARVARAVTLDAEEAFDVAFWDYTAAKRAYEAELKKQEDVQNG
jgi:hypothetical protein